MKSATHFLYKLRYFGRGFPTSIDGEIFRFDETLRRWNFASEIPVHRVLREKLRVGSVFFDVGANFGQLAIPAATWVTSAGQVHAFEPVPRHAALLERHKSLNQRGTELIIIDSAVSNDPSEHLQFEIPNEEVAVEAGLRISSHAGPVNTLRVKNLRLDDYCQQTGTEPHVIKIDVEGAELEVLRGAEQMLYRASPVLVIEIHDFALPTFETSSAEITEYLRGIGYNEPKVIQKESGSKPWHHSLFSRA